MKRLLGCLIVFKIRSLEGIRIANFSLVLLVYAIPTRTWAKNLDKIKQANVGVGDVWSQIMGTNVQRMLSQHNPLLILTKL